MNEQANEKPLSGSELIIVAIILAILSAILLPQCTRTESVGSRLILPASIGPNQRIEGAVRAVPFNARPNA